MSDLPPSALFPADNPAATAHIALLQGIINRLAGNSASCKTWCLTLVSALLGFAAAAHTPRIVLVTILPILVFNFLDAMYLAQERAYRELFIRVVEDIRHGKYSREQVFTVGAPMKRQYVKDAFLSWSIWPIYGSLLALYVGSAIVAVFMKFNP